MKALILIDSFKGTLTSKELGQITKEELKKKNIESDYFPISDGGDGFLDAISSVVDLTKVEVKTFDAFLRPIHSYYLVNEKENVAYIELAKSAGINLVKKEELNPFVASTFGLGVTISDAIEKGYKKIVVGIGGSATNDGGSGMLEALKAKFYSKGTLVSNMNNQKLGLIDDIDISELRKFTKGIEFLVMSDVNNPLLGEKGATFVFSKQKGAKEEELVKLEANMTNYKLVSEKVLGFDYSKEFGSGAAGGVGFGLRAYLGAKFQAGIDYLLNQLSQKDLSSYDTVITGEGKIDSQSLDGKVISGVMKHFKDKRIVFVCALNELDDFKGEVYSIVPFLATKQESMAYPKKYFTKLVKTMFNKYKGVIYSI